MIHKISVFFCFIFAIVGVTIFAQSENNSSNLPEVPILGTQLQKITSAIDGQEYVLYVNLPRNYNDTTKKFPIIYVLDGQWDFPLVQALYGQQYYDGFVPATIVVGITWGGKNPDYDARRAFDLTPTSGNQPADKYGNAPKFLQCIKKEIIPFIESKYRVDNSNRTLMGSSFGGLFTLYTMFTETSLFNRYILTSPAVTWDNGVIYKIENEYHEKNKSLPVRLFIGWGSYEAQPVFQRFIDTLKSRNYEGLDFHSWAVEGCGHSGAKAEGYTKGLQAVFKKKSLTLDKSILDSYAGSYQVTPGYVIKLSDEDNSLVAQMPDNSKIVLHAQSDTDFFVNGMYFFVQFKKDDSGKVTGFNYEQFTGGAFAHKIN